MGHNSTFGEMAVAWVRTTIQTCLKRELKQVEHIGTLHRSSPISVCGNTGCCCSRYSEMIADTWLPDRTTRQSVVQHDGVMTRHIVTSSTLHGLIKQAV